MVRKPRKPKFPRKSKSSNADSLERWVKKCEELANAYNKKHSEWKKLDDRKVSLIKRGEKAKVLK